MGKRVRLSDPTPPKPLTDAERELRERIAQLHAEGDEVDGLPRFLCRKLWEPYLSRVNVEAVGRPGGRYSKPAPSYPQEPAKTS